jgi:hypothetical protein
VSTPGYTFSAYRIAEKALRKIGAFPITDSAADALEMREALDWLTIIMAELAGRDRVFWLVPATLSIPLTATVASYDIQATMGTDYPDLGVQFPIEAFIQDDAGNRYAVEIVQRSVFEHFTNRDKTGPIEAIYIDRLYPPTLYTFPTLADTSKSWTVELTVQTFAPDFQGNTDRATGLRSAWQMWCIYTLSKCLGDGSITRVPNEELIGFERLAMQSYRQLWAYEQREHDSMPPVCMYRG